MKLLIENWRGYLKEEQAPKAWDDWTIGQLNDLIDNARSGEDIQAREWLVANVGVEIVKDILGGPAAVVDLMKGLYKQVNRQEAESDDNPEDFPILDLLDMDPEFFNVLDQEILNGVDEKYQEYLQGLDSATRIGDVMDINDYIRKYVAEVYPTTFSAAAPSARPLSALYEKDGEY